MTLHTGFWLLIGAMTLGAGGAAIVLGISDALAFRKLVGRRAWGTLLVIGVLFVATWFAAAACFRLALT